MRIPPVEIGEGAGGMTLGVLALENAGGADSRGGLKGLVRELEAELREKYGGRTRAELKALHPMDVYVAYYKRFGYTYHVLPQLESVAAGKDIPDALPPVAAMFAAELKNMLLTAAHDLDKVVLPITLRRSTGDEIMPAMNGRDVSNLAGDFMVADREGVISAILRGCDRRTAVSDATMNILYTVYAPQGIPRELVRRHLDDIEAAVRTYAEPGTLLKEIY